MSNPMSDRLLADGISLTLRNGDQTREVRLRYGMRGIKMLQDECGSLSKAIDVVGTIGDPDTKQIDTLMLLLAAGLIHEELSADELLDWTDLRSLGAYTDAIYAAISEAFPAAEGPSPNVVGTTKRKSPGTNSITSRRSGSVEAIASSGA